MDELLVTTRLKALADPGRWRLVKLLAESPNDHVSFDPRCSTAHGVCFCHLEEQLGLSKPTVSHHLKVLREAGLVEGIRVGKWTYYRLNRAAVDELRHVLGNLQPTTRLIQLELPTA